MAIDRWTQDVPTVDGRYWLAVERDWPAVVVQVYCGRYRLLGDDRGEWRKFPAGWWWYGPLEQPR